MEDTRRKNPEIRVLTAAQLLARTKPFTRNELVFNSDTGELRMGRGLWKNLVRYNGEDDVTFTVRAATTANITVATALNDGDALDGVTLSTGNVVLVKNQSSASANGLYVVGASPARLTGFTTIAAFSSILVSVTSGSTNGGKFFRSTGAATGTIDSTNITFGPVSQGSLKFSKRSQLAALPAGTSSMAGTSIVAVELADGTVVGVTLTQLKASLALLP